MAERVAGRRLRAGEALALVAAEVCPELRDTYRSGSTTASRADIGCESTPLIPAGCQRLQLDEGKPC